MTLKPTLKKGYKVKLNINDEKLDIVYYRKYSEEKLKNI